MKGLKINLLVILLMSFLMTPLMIYSESKTNLTPPLTMQLSGEESKYIDDDPWGEGVLDIFIRKYEAGEELTNDEKIKLIVLLNWVNENDPWPESEVLALVEELKQKKNEAIDKAVAAAVIEYRGQIAAKDAEIEDLEKINDDLGLLNKSLKGDNYKYAAGGVLAGALLATIIFFTIEK